MNDWLEVSKEGMRIFGFTVDYTAGPIITLIVSPIIVWAVSFYVARLIRKSDESKAKLIADREAREHQRYEDLKLAFSDKANQLVDKIDNICESNEKLHKQRDKLFWNHDHDNSGNIIIKGGM